MKKQQRILNRLLKDLKKGSFEYKFKDGGPLDWHAYNLAKINEIKLLLPFVRNAVEEACPKEGRKKGRILASDLAKIVLLQQYFQKSERVMEVVADIFREKLHINVVPSARTISRAYLRRDVRKILKKVLFATSEPIMELEKSFSADSTDQPLSIKQNYENDRGKHEKHAGYDRVAVMISNNYQIATSALFVHGTANDNPLFEPLLNETAERFFIEDVEADAGFLSRKNAQAVADLDGVPNVYPKIGVKTNQDGAPAWRKMLEGILKDPQGWLEIFYRRENSESYFSSYKRRFARSLLNRLPKARRSECLARITVQNIYMLINAYFCNDVKCTLFRG
ncbi:MAG: hypothetical protein ABIH83_06025 [Candidatus Micrarchaeota archaeon]